MVWPSVVGFTGIGAVLVWLFWPWGLRGKRRRMDDDAPDEFWL